MSTAGVIHRWEYGRGLCRRKSDGRLYAIGRDRSHVPFARVLMEVTIGRSLLPDEHVHHKNGDCTDDRIENLEVLSRSDHQKRHGHGWRTSRWTSGVCSGCGCDLNATNHGCSTCYSRMKARARKAKGRV